MKRHVRLLALLLALIMCSAFLAACDGDEGDETTTAPTTTQNPAVTTKPTTTAPAITTAPQQVYTQDWEELNFEDTAVRILYNDYVTTAMSDAGAGNSLLYLKGPDDYAGASRGDYKAAYERHRKVADALNLTLDENLTYRMANWDGNCDSIINDIRAFVDSNSDENPTVVIHQNYGMVRAGILGFFFNALDDEEENYFNLDHKNWYRDMMLENTIDPTEIYMLMGDYTIDQLRFSFGVLVNSGIANDALAIFDGMDYIYDLVDQNAWTYDAMMELASFASNADSGVTGDDLVMGVISDSWVVRNFFAASGLDVFGRDPAGLPYYKSGEEINPIHDWVDELITMDTQSYFSYNWQRDAAYNPSKTSPATTFVNGGSLFALSQMILTLEGENVQDMDNPAGILPNPLYVPDNGTTAGLKYQSLVSDNANAAGVLITSDAREFTAASAFLQMMTEESDNFYQMYFVEGLQRKNNSIGAEHAEMLQIIREGLCSPMSFLYDNYVAKDSGLETYGAIMYKSIDAGSNTFSSDWDHQLPTKVARLETLKGNYGPADN